MEEDTDTFGKAKPKAKELIEKKFVEIESGVDTKVPKGLRCLAEEVFEEIYPCNLDEYLGLVLSIDAELNFLMAYIKENGDDLDANCKDFIDRLLTELFELTDGKGVQYDFWRHMPKIWHFNQVAESYGQDETTSVSIEWKIDQVVKAYSTIYELTLYILIDICLKIAEIKSFNDPYSKTFVREYTQKLKSNSTISRNDLIQYLNRQSFLKGWQCSMLKSAFIRNKIAHADYYYDAEENTLIFGKRPYKLEEFKKILKGMNSFYCYFLWRYLQEAGIMGMIDEMNRLRDAAKQIIDKDNSDPTLPQ